MAPWDPLDAPLDTLGSPGPLYLPQQTRKQALDPFGTLWAYPLTLWDPVGLPLDPLRPYRPTA